MYTLSALELTAQSIIEKKNLGTNLKRAGRAMQAAKRKHRAEAAPEQVLETRYLEEHKQKTPQNKMKLEVLCGKRPDLKKFFFLLNSFKFTFFRLFIF